MWWQSAAAMSSKQQGWQSTNNQIRWETQKMQIRFHSSWSEKMTKQINEMETSSSFPSEAFSPLLRVMLLAKLATQQNAIQQEVVQWNLTMNFSGFHQFSGKLNFIVSS